MERLFKRVRENKLLLLVGAAVILCSAFYFLLTTPLAGYTYLKFTSTQMEIVPKHDEWDNRAVIGDGQDIDEVLSLINEAEPFNESISTCDVENMEMQLLIRRNLAKTDLSWRVCKGKDVTYLFPLLVDKRDEGVYVTDSKLMLLLEEFLEK